MAQSTCYTMTLYVISLIVTWIYRVGSVVALSLISSIHNGQCMMPWQSIAYAVHVIMTIG